jgi:hypothetical protein
VRQEIPLSARVQAAEDLKSSLIISVISEQHEDTGKYGPGRMWRECSENGVCVMSLEIVGTSARERMAGRPVHWDSIRSGEFLKWTPPCTELKQTKDVPADN